MLDALSKSGGDAPWSNDPGGCTHCSDDLRDIGWVRQNVPCQHACPAGTNIPAYIRSIAEGKHGQAYEINREANVLPGVLGRICARPCEDACRHGWPGNGEPVSICHLKRSAADMKDAGHRITERLFAPTGKRVAVVGAGPAGVAAAHDLALLGHDVVIFEKEELPGGMLRYGIPEFRLPRNILEIELHNALRVGVQLRTGTPVGVGKGAVRVSTLLADFDAVLLSTGCMAPVPLPLKGIIENQDVSQITQDVEYGLNFLTELHRGQNKRVGRRVAVVGAGFTALDCARVARRLGGMEVTIHLRTSEEYIPVTKEELFETKREGIRIKGLRTPVGLQLDSTGRLLGVEFVQNRLGGWREGGRRLAVPIEGSEFSEACDTLIIAIGQRTVNDFLDVRVEVGRSGTVRVAENGMTSVPGLFAAGDYVRGASTAIEAIGHGRRIADQLDTWLVGRKRHLAVQMEPVAAPLRERSFDFIPRQHMPTVPLAERPLLREVECGYNRDLAAEEAKRCYLCDLRYQINVDRCIYCRACIEVAPRNCIKLVQDVAIQEDGSYGNLQETKEWNRVAAIWIDNNECIRCGACFKVCPVACISITRNKLVTVEG
ncbi:FAD-dependent oxidoreductase [Candidatus Magnetaquicoccus inordinatus]|uniref:FAD-dependent oxidoreductase n=1 Tax=Candidatus Magnetaquicoccus inordinatus TaxID=2496818 RepID=UPI00102CAC01|nr:FAD-dependent oxidoreductase [Candidatus Magnetaquicoccus inordinatus]